MTHAQRFWFHLSEMRPEHLFIKASRDWKLEAARCLRVGGEVQKLAQHPLEAYP